MTNNMVDWFNKTEALVSRLEKSDQSRQGEITMKTRVASQLAGRSFIDSRFASYSIASGSFAGSDSGRTMQSSLIRVPSWARQCVVVSEAPQVRFLAGSPLGSPTSFVHYIYSFVNGEPGETSRVDIGVSPVFWQTGVLYQNQKVHNIPRDRHLDLSFTVSAPANTSGTLFVAIRSLVMWIGRHE